MPKFVGSPLTIPAAAGPNEAVQKTYVDAADTALASRVATLEANPSSGGGGSGQSLSVKAITANTTAAAGDFILADASSAAITVTLPASPPTNSSVAVKKIDSGMNLVVTKGAGSALIDGDSTMELTQAQSGAILIYDGTNWRVEATVIFDPGAKNFTARGTWTPAVAYGINDVVSYQGTSYVAQLGSTNVTPTSDTVTWTLLAAKGDTGNQGPVGATGPTGAKGDPGDAASSGYLHFQTVPATVWQIPHQLGYDPAGIVVIDVDGYTIDDGGVQYMTAGQSLRLSFDLAIAGTAYLS